MCSSFYSPYFLSLYYSNRYRWWIHTFCNSNKTAASLILRFSSNSLFTIFFWCASYLGDGSRCSCSLRLAEESEELGKKNWGRQGEPLVDGPSERTRAQGGRRERHADGEPDFLAAAKVASGIGNDDDDVGRHLVDEVTRSFTGIWGIRFQ